MAKSEQTNVFTRSAHRSRDRSHVPDKAVEPAAYCGRAGCDHCKIASDYATNTARRPDGVCRDCDLCRNPDWQLDGVDKIPIRRSDRINSENCIPRLDPKTIHGLVAAPDFYAARSLDLLVGFDRDFLAGRGQMERANVALLAGRWILCHLLPRIAGRGADRIAN